MVQSCLGLFVGCPGDGPIGMDVREELDDFGIFPVIVICLVKTIELSFLQPMIEI
jgi:hypothetical protein